LPLFDDFALWYIELWQPNFVMPVSH